MTQATRVPNANGATVVSNALTVVYNRRPGIYFKPFTLGITATIHWTPVGAGKNIGVWKVPYNQAPAALNAGVSANSEKLMNFDGTSTGSVRTVTQYISNTSCFVSVGGPGGVSGSVIDINANPRYWYRIYPYDGAVTASAASGSILGGVKTVTFDTPQCIWPTYYTGANSYNYMNTGLLWPDVLLTYSTSGTPADPTYDNTTPVHYSSSTQKTTASLNLAANQTYTVKVCLAVRNGALNSDDVEYGKVTTYTYYTYTAPIATPAAGTLFAPQAVTLSGASEGQTIRYTTDGSAPTAGSPIYSAPIFVEGATTIKAQKYIGTTPVSPVGTYAYSITAPQVTASPVGGSTVMRGSEVSLTTINSEQTDILYTTNPIQPRETWTVYQSPIAINKDLSLYVVTRDKASGWYGEVREFAYAVTDLGYALNDLSFWDGSKKIAPDAELSSFAGRTLTAKANITKIIPSIQGWLVTALYDPSGHAQVKLDRLDQLSGTVTGDVVGKAITLPTDTTRYVLKTFIVYDFAQLRPVGNIVQLGEREE